MLLPWIIIIPFIFGIFLWQFEKFKFKKSKYIALLSIIIYLIFIIIILFKKNIYLPKNTYLNNNKYEYIKPWINKLNINIYFQIDNLSLLMIFLISILGLVSIICTWNIKIKFPGFYYMNLLWIISFTTGIFISHDIFLFFFFWEITLIPIYILILIYGNNKNYYLFINYIKKFFIYTQISSLIMFITIIGLVIINYKITGIFTFNYTNISKTLIPINIQYILMYGFLISFSIKMPLIPFHNWLINIHEITPISGSLDIIGFLLKISQYGMIKFIIQLFPAIYKKNMLLITILGLINIFYGSILSFSQNNIKKFIVYNNISHIGYILIAIYINNNIAYNGAIIYMICHSISSSGLFIICDQIYNRLNTHNIKKMGSLWNKLNYIPAFFLFFLLSSIGIPGTGNFIGEFYILLGIFSKQPIIAYIMIFGIIFSSISSLIFMKKIFYGKKKYYLKIKNIFLYEKIILLILSIIIIIIGIFPKPIIFIISNLY